MPSYALPYGRSHINVTLPPSLHVTLITPKLVSAAPDPQTEVDRALTQLLGGVSWLNFSKARRAVIVISDKTRPVPNHLLLPPLLERIHALGVATENTTLLIGAGCHPPLTLAEYAQVLTPDLLERYRVFSHDCDDSNMLVNQGETPSGTPVWANRHFIEADLRIVVGNIEPHQFQGYSGGAKGAAIGVAGRATINANHSLMTHPQAQLGQYADNPARQDVETIGQAMGIHLAVNAILNQDKQLVKALAGTPLAVMQAGIPLVRDACQAAIPRLLDVVIATPGGHPKDINLYQAQKALAHAAPITRPGGFVILIAACPEGAGDESFQAWMEQRQSLADVLETFEQEGFRVGPHKAFLLARDAARVQVRLVSEMSAESVRRLLLTPVPTVEAAVEEAMYTLPAPLHMGIMPQANVTVPVLTRRTAVPRESPFQAV